MKPPNGKSSCKNGYLQIVIHRGRASACGEKFTVMTACNTFGKRPCGWGAQKPCVIRAEAHIDFTSLTRSVFTCSKRLLFEHPYYRKFTGTCGCNPKRDTRCRSVLLKRSMWFVFRVNFPRGSCCAAGMTPT